MAEDDDLPVKVDVSLKAELKGEIPTEKVGNAVDAILDTFSPFTQGMGLIGDHLRFHREKVIIRIGELAKKRADNEGLKIKPVPPKFMVPFIEKASCEDLEGEIINQWAFLLNKASTEYDSILLSFVDILSRIGSREVKLLSEIHSLNPVTSKAVPFLSGFKLGMMDVLISKFLKTEKIKLPEENGPIVPISISISSPQPDSKNEGGEEILGEYVTSQFYFKNELSFNMLCKENIFRFTEVYKVSANRSFKLELVEITPFGIAFIEACFGKEK